MADYNSVYYEEKSPLKAAFDRLIKNIKCLVPRLTRKFARKPDYHDYHYGKREVVNSFDDCFDDIDEPLYGIRVEVRPNQKFCRGDDFGCFGARDFFQSKQGEEFFSEDPPDCRLTQTDIANCP